MELGLHIRLGEVRLSIAELLALEQGMVAKLDWDAKHLVGLWFDDECVAEGFLQTDEEHLYFQAAKVYRSTQGCAAQLAVEDSATETRSTSCGGRKHSELSDDTSSSDAQNLCP